MARQKAMEETRIARQRGLDSMKKIRQRRTDSLAAVKKYRESKKYKDSVTKSRTAKLDAVKAARTAQLDSVKAARKQVLDSTLASRKSVTDQIRAVQKRRTDSMATIRKYRESKRYQDSVVVVRKLKMDSVKAVRKVFSDSVTAARKKNNDSVAAVRKATLDSTIAVRKKSMDSLKAVRKVRTDSLAKVKEQRDKLKKIREKEKEEKMQLAFELKIKKKQEAWSNEKMLKKKWSLPRQAIQNTFTRYNYYFNADRKMDEALDNMQRIRKEDYDRQLALFPFDPDVDSTVLAPDMDSIIQKASVGIQIHDPRTKWGDDLYLLLGQAYYYKGDYNNASTTFRYIVSLRDKLEKKKPNNTKTKAGAKGASIAQAENNGFLDFLKHRTAHNEALLWLSRTYTEAHQEGNAESVIDLLEADANMPASLKGRLALEKAYMQLSLGNNKEAIPELDIVSKDKELPEWVRMRAAFLNGQLLQQAGDHQKAATSFEQVLALNPKIDMDFYARRNVAQSRMMSGGDQEEALASLKKVLNDGKYSPYYEQIYYMMGRLASNGNKHKEAIDYLQKSISTSKSTRRQKALSFAALGNVYYDMHQYLNAKSYYDSAASLASAAGGDSMFTAALRRSMVLGNVTGPLISIRNADSLLTLAAMNSRDQQNVVRRHIRRLEQIKSDSAFKAENAGVQNAQQQQGNSMPGNNTNTYTNWYFSNPVLMQQGMNEFKRKWGSRSLTDNWRRSSASGGFVGNQGAAGSAGDDEEETGLDENGLPTEASLLAFIPNTAPKQEALRTRNMAAYMSMARAYVNDLQDLPQALVTLDTLEKRYPNHPDKAEAVYLRYQVALKQGLMEEAKKHTAKLLRDYPETKWAALVRPSEDGSGSVAVSSASMANFYDESYGLLMQRQYTDVLQRMQVAKKQYSDPTYKKRFQIMEAIALVGSGDYGKAEGLLGDFMSSHPSDSLRAWAEATLGYIKTHKPATPPPTPPAGSGFAPDTTSGGGKGAMRAAAESNSGVSAPSAPVTPPAPSVPDAFTYKPNEEHYVVFSFATMEQRAMGVKAAMNDFNTFKFTGQGLTSDLQMVNKSQGVIVTQKFKNVAQARLYMTSLRGTAQVFREYKTGEYNIFVISANNYVKMMHDRDIQPYMKFYNANYK
ncbi:MAG: tetratricopeptide repeat protein [Sphingobacteriales bacterium]|nr:MAG: tetratricopeptide repeat protein [Sphingobacteriales bacterium]